MCLFFEHIDAYIAVTRSKKNRKEVYVEKKILMKEKEAITLTK